MPSTVKRISYYNNKLRISCNIFISIIFQVINLRPNELQWLCSHLGHTTRVHMEHYRQMSGFIERVKISKVLLLQDMNLTEKMVGKSLDEIASIPFGGIRFTEVTHLFYKKYSNLVLYFAYDHFYFNSSLKKNSKVIFIAKLSMPSL